MELTVKVVGALASVMMLGVALLLIYARLRGSKPRPELPRGFFRGARTVALELAESPREVSKILDQPGRDARGEIRKETYLDFAFIASYWLLFMALSVLLAQRSLALGSWFASIAAIGAALAAVCATAAAQVDFLENLRLYALLDTFPRRPDHEQRMTEIEQRIKDVRDAARVKFGLIFFAAALLSPVFLWSVDWWLFDVIGVVFLLAAFVGLLGLWRYRAAVVLAFLMMLFGVLLIAVGFNFSRESLVSVLTGS